MNMKLFNIGIKKKLLGWYKGMTVKDDYAATHYLYTMQAEVLLPKVIKPGKIKLVEFYSSSKRELEAVKDAALSKIDDDKELNSIHYLVGSLPVLVSGKFVFSIPFKYIHFGEIDKTSIESSEISYSSTNIHTASIFMHAENSSTVVRIVPKENFKYARFAFVGGLSNNISPSEAPNLIPTVKLPNDALDEFLLDVEKGKFTKRVNLLKWNMPSASYVSKPIDEALENKKADNAIKVLVDGYPFITGLTFNET